MAKVPEPGDIFSVLLPDGRYGAIRVLRKDGKSSLVLTSEYLATECPKLDNPLLYRPVVQKRFFFSGERAVTWVNGNPPKNFVYVGNVPLTESERAIDCQFCSYSGKWDETTGDKAFLEWRWVHDRPAFEAEVQKDREERERLLRLPQKPKKMMSEDEFWSIIDLLDWKKQGNDDKVLTPAMKALATRSKTEICRFAERLAFVLYNLDTKAHASVVGESDDGFLYSRCVVVANGRAFYETVLNDPTQMPKDMEFESLLRLAA